MIHVGAEPPWRGYSSHYGSWKREPDGWDGVTRWRWRPPSPWWGVSAVSRIITQLYTPTLKDALTRDLIFLNAVTEDADEHAELEP